LKLNRSKLNERTTYHLSETRFYFKYKLTCESKNIGQRSVYKISL